ncbi:histidine phosphatase family protein [Siminovitchia sediminis]|uniref:Histidine phosphatase family protein n=1 Tax=Siminovitchia sediminis TaxID=1274353 RepID=A0ABW4KGT8_9BACI
MQITFIRHLPTQWNKKTWLQGRRDIPISNVTETDIKQIQMNKKHLEKLPPFEAVVASTLQRTQQTARLYGYDPEIEPLLDELDFGQFEGVPKEQMICAWKHEWFNDPSSLTLGEPVCQLENRIRDFFQKYKSLSNLLVFGHGAWIRAALSLVENGNINQMNRRKLHNNECLTIQAFPDQR